MNVLKLLSTAASGAIIFIGGIVSAHAAKICSPTTEDGRPCIQDPRNGPVRSYPDYTGFYVSNICNKSFTVEGKASNKNVAIDIVPAGRSGYRVGYCKTSECIKYTEFKVFCENSDGDQAKAIDTPAELAPTSEKATDIHRNEKEFFKGTKERSPHDATMAECGQETNCLDQWETYFSSAPEAITGQYRQKHIDSCFKRNFNINRYCKTAKRNLNYAELFDIYKLIKREDETQLNILKNVSEKENEQSFKDNEATERSQKRKLGRRSSADDLAVGCEKVARLTSFLQTNGGAFESYSFDTLDKSTCSFAFHLGEGQGRLSVFFNSSAVNIDFSLNGGEVAVTFKCRGDVACIRERQFGESKMVRKSDIYSRS